MTVPLPFPVPGVLPPLAGGQFLSSGKAHRRVARGLASKVAKTIGYLVVGHLCWRQIFGSDPNRDRVHPSLQALMLLGAVPIGTFVGLSLDNPTHEIFPAYLAMHRAWGVSPVRDLDERRAERADRELDALYGDAPGTTVRPELAAGR
ncbi:MAG: cytochrome c oxidase assembly protein [Acidimicrobiales bacterium]